MSEFIFTVIVTFTFRRNRLLAFNADFLLKASYHSLSFSHSNSDLIMDFSKAKKHNESTVKVIKQNKTRQFMAIGKEESEDCFFVQKR